MKKEFASTVFCSRTMKIGDVDIKVTLKNVTISCGYDKYNQGHKDSNFISAGYEFPEGIEEEDLNLVAIILSKQVTQSTYLTALARGAISQEEYRLLFTTSNERHNDIREKIEQKRAEVKNGTNS